MHHGKGTGTRDIEQIVVVVKKHDFLKPLKGKDHYTQHRGAQTPSAIRRQYMHHSKSSDARISDCTHLIAEKR
jgi:hypothetical protein